MFNFLKKKVSRKTEELKQAAGKFESKDTVEGAVALMVWVAFADGKCEPSEIEQLENVIKSDDAFSQWQSELPGMVSKWIDKFKLFKRGAVQDALKELTDLKNDPVNAAKVLVAGLAVADDDGIGEDEKAVLNQAAGAMGLRLDTYL